MGLGDFFNGVKEAGGKALDVATDVASGHAVDTAIDWGTEVSFEKPGQLLSAVGKGVNWGADQAGKVGDATQRLSDAAGLPSPVGSVANFMTGGGTQWLGRSVGDTAQTVGFLGENVDTAMKGVLSGAQLLQENPHAVGEALSFGANYAMNHKMDIAKGVGKAALDEATDPVSIALMVGTGGGSAAIKGAAEAGAKGLAEGGIKAATSAAARSAAESLVGAGGKAVATEGIEEVAETAGKAATRTAGEAVADTAFREVPKVSFEAAGAAAGEEVADTASKGLIRDVFSGRNLPASETPGLGGTLDRIIEGGKLRPNPTGRMATRRAAWADAISGEGDSILKDALANKIRAGSGKPVHGGEAAVNAWRAKNIYSDVKHLNTAREGMEIAADPKGYAMEKLSGLDKSSLTNDLLGTVRTSDPVTSSTEGSSSVGALSQPRTSYSNQYTPRGFSQPSALPSRGPATLTTGQSSMFQVRDPYAEGTEYGKAEGSYTVRDPYKPLVQPKKQPKGMYSV